MRGAISQHTAFFCSVGYIKHWFSLWKSFIFPWKSLIPHENHLFSHENQVFPPIQSINPLKKISPANLFSNEINYFQKGGGRGKLFFEKLKKIQILCFTVISKKEEPESSWLLPLVIQVKQVLQVLKM